MAATINQNKKIYKSKNSMINSLRFEELAKSVNPDNPLYKGSIEETAEEIKATVLDICDLLECVLVSGPHEASNKGISIVHDSKIGWQISL